MKGRKIATLFGTVGLLAGGWYALHTAQTVAQTPATAQNLPPDDGQQARAPAFSGTSGSEAEPPMPTPPSVQAITGASGGESGDQTGTFIRNKHKHGGYQGEYRQEYAQEED